jgi:hypothetical protein
MQQVAELEKELVTISSADLNELETELRKHEGKLRVIMEAASKNNELEYRHDHKIILFRVQHVAGQMRGFKKSVFARVKE